jgi:hypothetical protein
MKQIWRMSSTGTFETYMKSPSRIGSNGIMQLHMATKKIIGEK